MRGIWFVLALGLLAGALSGCYTVRGDYLIYTRHGKVPGDIYDHALRQHAAKLPKGPPVSGRDCTSSLFFGLIPLTFSTTTESMEDVAFEKAVAKAGLGYDALIHAKGSITRYLLPPPLLQVTCYELSGIAAKDRPFYSAEEPPAGKEP